MLAYLHLWKPPFKWKIHESPTKMDEFGVPPFQDSPDYTDETGVSYHLRGLVA
jgi:hypothetical protein